MLAVEDEERPMAFRCEGEDLPELIPKDMVGGLKLATSTSGGSSSSSSSSLVAARAVVL
jgi:hypothetical protein